jgi:hypothetical protein
VIKKEKKVDPNARLEPGTLGVFDWALTTTLKNQCLDSITLILPYGMAATVFDSSTKLTVIFAGKT